ncbi:probable 3-beta-hydroxysteroid-Delta(8),Delta(7)-isomerase [Coffea arabica]|uniref:Probable 3-beta-hydroxysteroid-Delta(8),Delta(7)-isomerase n=1 Tax=Coffea arabica TaxID=13443 RepID=A0A6P6UP68_COFAR|nr:probable 3-beta-hydroxysteroid-Delta(8),Delta(7)-isomerase [Coffea arabica]
MAIVGEVEHPYVPRDLKLPGFVPAFLPPSTIVGAYLLASLLAVSIVWIGSGRIHKISKLDRILMCWWIFTGLTHMVLEGYFVFTPDFYKKTTPVYLAEVWKEYSKGDSRYAARDSGVVSIEGVTVVLEGPFCLLTLFAIATKKSYRYVIQLAISLGQLYGTIVYFLTSYLDGDNFAASWFYYYAYYVLANAFWVLIPTAISVHCWKKICEAIKDQDLKKTKTS